MESVGILLAGLGIFLFSFYFLGWVVLEVWILRESKQSEKNGNGKNGNGKHRTVTNGKVTGSKQDNVKESNWQQKENNLRGM